MTTLARMNVGAVEVVSVSDGVLYFDRANFFPRVPDEAWAAYPEDLEPDGRILLNVGSFVLRSEGKTVLVDTGLGPHAAGYDSDCGHLMEQLALDAVAPGEVDLVLMTHVHPDHVGWNMSYDGDNPAPTFPNARYLVPQADWDASVAATRQAAASPDDAALNRRAAVFTSQVQPLEGSGQLETYAGERPITASITTLPTPGHTAGHTSVLIQSEGERALIAGDLLHMPLELHETSWTTRADGDPELAVATRIEVLDRIEREGSTLIAGHFPAPGFGRLVRMQGRRYWRALDV